MRHRVLSLPFLCALACTGQTSAPPTAPAVPLHEPGGAPVTDLRRLPGTWTLPAPDADAPSPTTTWILPQAQPYTGPGLRTIHATWATPLPFELADDELRVPPPGFRVQVDGRDLPFSRRASPVDGWRVHDGALLLALDARPEQIVVSHPALAGWLARLDPARSGLPPDAWARHQLTLGEDTRSGLLLPHGGGVQWSLTPPPGARFEAAVGMVEDRLPHTEGGATIVLTARTRTGEEELARVEVPATTDAFTPVRADLSGFAGQGITLHLTRADEARGDLPLLAHPVVVGTRVDTPPRRIVWIGLDTLRRDALSLYGNPRPTSPRLDAWAEQATVFEGAVTPAPRTRPSFRSALTGRRPLDAVGSPVLLELLGEEGFATAGIVANVHLDRRFGFTAGADKWRLDPSAKADEQVDRAIAWLNAHAERDAALFLHIMDPHLAYIPPEPHRSTFVRDPDPRLPDRFSRSMVLRWMQQGLDDRRKQHIRDLYDAEVAFTDAELGRLLAHLDTLPGRTLVVMHSDHGEEFWEHGGFEHNHSLKPEVHDAVFMVRLPGQQQGRRIPTTTELADLLPTVLDLVGADARPATDGRSLRALLEGGALPDVPQDLGHLMYGRERWGVREDGLTYVLWTGTGREELYDRSVDPGEQDDLAPSLPVDDPRLVRLRERLGEVHGADVGPGWRIRVDLGEEVLALELPAPATDARVLDPERERPHRANQAWGEVPAVRPSEVATVRLEEDGRRLVVVPGSIGSGTIVVRFAAPTPVGGTVKIGGLAHPLTASAPSLPGVERLQIEPGTVILAPPDEAARMRALGEGPVGVDGGTQDALIEFGYLRETDEGP